MVHHSTDSDNDVGEKLIGCGVPNPVGSVSASRGGSKIYLGDIEKSSCMRPAFVVLPKTGDKELEDRATPG